MNSKPDSDPAEPESYYKKDSNLYFYVRKLYFEPKLDEHEQVKHLYSSNEIAKLTQAQYHCKMSASTIRRWTSSPDKDFDGRTWLQEWNRTLAEGIATAGEQSPPAGHPFQTENSQPEIPLTPMQRLAKLKQKSLENDMDIAIAGDTFTKLFIREMKDDYERTKKVPEDKLRILGAFHQNAKARVMTELKDLKDLESQLDRELQYGKLVALKEPQARERVRTVFIKMLELAYERGKRTNQS